MRVRHMMFRTLLAGMLLPCAGMAGADDLISLYRHAVEYDADYRATAANTEADREEINKARAQFFPKAQFSASRGRGETDRTTQTALGPLDTHLNYSTRNYALSIRQPLFNKEVAAGYQSARAYVSEQESLLLEARGKLMLKVTEAYLQTVYTRERIALLEAKIEATGRQLAQAKKRYDGGVGTVVEVSEAQTNLEVSVAELARARAELEGYTMTLRNMTGRSTDDGVWLAPERLSGAIVKEDSPELWLQSADATNPEMAAARYAVEVARQEVERKRAGHYPSVDLVGVRSYSENDSNNTLGSSFDSTTVAVQLNMPLYAGGLVSANVRQAHARLSAAQESLESKSREIASQVREHFNGIRSQSLAVDAYQQAVRAAEIARDGTEKAFLAGMKTNADVLDAQQRFFASRLELSHARYQLVSHLISLQHLSGLLNEEALTKVSQLFVNPSNSHQSP